MGEDMSAFSSLSRLAAVAASASFAFALTCTVSHQAMAACTSAGTPPAITCDSADDTVSISTGANGAISTDGGADSISVSGGTTGNITAGDGNDRIVITGGTTGGVQGNAGDDVLVLIDGTVSGNFNGDGGNASAGPPATLNSGSDRIFMFGGHVTGEVQNGPGADNFTLLFGGTVDGTVEMQRGTVDSIIVIDGARVLGGVEMQNPNTATNGQLAVNPTIYLRSGFVGIGTWGNNNDSHFIIDPVNSKAAEQFKTAALSGSFPSTATLMGLINNGVANAGAHMLVIGEGAEDDDDDDGGGDAATIALRGGNDTLDFIGAVNNGSGTHNLHFGEEDEDEEEVPTFDADGGPGTDTPGSADRINVSGVSDLLLAGLKNFEYLTVTGGSRLTLTDDDYTFAERVTVDGTSELYLSGTEVEFTTSHLELLAGDGIEERLAGLPSYYADFATGAILRIGAGPGAGNDDDDDDFAALDDDDDDDDDAPSGVPVSVRINTGASTFVNDHSTIVMMNGIVGDSLTLTGPYTSIAGNLAIDTELGGSDSDTDTLTIDGSVAGTTTIYVANVGGKGAFTGQGEEDGIVIVEGDGFTEDSFKLAVNALTGNEEVLAGAFAYRLRVNEDEALLQSDILDQVPAYVTAPSVGQRLVSNGLDTLYKRLGEIRNGQGSGATSADGLIWVRGSFSDVDVDAKEGFGFSQRSNGVTAGLGGVIASDSGARLAIGVFGAYGTADADVDAVIFGAASKSSIDADAWSGGGYATYYEVGRPGTGLYVDTVVKADFLSFDMSAASRGVRSSSDGDALTASAEVGYGFGVGGGLVVQPQAQIAYTDVSIDGFEDSYGVSVSYGSAESLIGRLGLQLQANLVQPDGGLISPYALFNVYSEFEGDNQSRISGVEFASDVSGTWYSAGGGVTAKLANALSFYGSGEYHFGDVEGWQGTGGLKVNW
jgi:outer membrane autotransporter protein